MPIYYENKLNLYGYYLGLDTKAKSVVHSEGFISDSKNEKIVKSVASYIGLMESVFLAQEGSTKRYKQERKRIIPELYSYEYNEGDIEFEAFKSIQTGIHNYVVDANSLIGLDDYTLNGYDSYLPFRKFGTVPRIKDIINFADFRYLSEGIFYFAKVKKRSYYLFHVDELKKDLLKSRWKIGFMKRLCVVQLPYFSIYRKIHERK